MSIKAGVLLCLFSTFLSNIAGAVVISGGTKGIKYSEQFGKYVGRGVCQIRSLSEVSGTSAAMAIETGVLIHIDEKSRFGYVLATGHAADVFKAKNISGSFKPLLLSLIFTPDPSDQETPILANGYLPLLADGLDMTLIRFEIPKSFSERPMGLGFSREAERKIGTHLQPFFLGTFNQAASNCENQAWNVFGEKKLNRIRRVTNILADFVPASESLSYDSFQSKIVFTTYSDILNSSRNIPFCFEVPKDEYLFLSSPMGVISSGDSGSPLFYFDEQNQARVAGIVRAIFPDLAENETLKRKQPVVRQIAIAINQRVAELILTRIKTDAFFPIDVDFRHRNKGIDQIFDPAL